MNPTILEIINKKRQQDRHKDNEESGLRSTLLAANKRWNIIAGIWVVHLRVIKF